MESIKRRKVYSFFGWLMEMIELEEIEELLAPLKIKIFIFRNEQL